MSNAALIQHLSNEVLHDLEKKLESSTCEEEEIFWEAQIEVLEARIEILRNSSTEEFVPQALVMAG